MCFATVRAMIELDDLRDLPLFEGVSSTRRSAAWPRWPPTCASTPGSGSCARASRRRSTCSCPGRGTSSSAIPTASAGSPRSEPGDWLGDLPIVFGAPFFAGARAVTPMRVARFDRAQFGLLVRTSDAFKQRLIARIQLRVEGLENQAAEELHLPDRDRPLARSGVPQPARLPLTQPGALRVGGSGRRLGRGPARPGGRDRRGCGLLGGAAARRAHPHEPLDHGARRGGRPAGRAPERHLRPRGRGRRPDGPCGGRVRSIGRAAHAARRARGDRRPGRHVDAHRELPRLPERRLGRRPGSAGGGAGAAAGRRDRRHAQHRGDRPERRLPHRHARRRRHARSARGDRGDRRLLPSAAGRWARRVRRHRRLLRSGPHRGAGDAGPRRRSSSAAATRRGRRRSSSPTTRAA